MKEKTINIATDYSRYPAGRFMDDGPYNGTKFRKKFLVPSLTDYDLVYVNLDGVRGVGSSFLEEAFGGLLRAGVGIDTIERKLKIICADSSILEEVTRYISDEAKKQSK